MNRPLEEALYQATFNRDREQVARLLAEGANPNKITCQGKTSLGEAANLGSTEILKLLLEASKETCLSKKVSPIATVRKRYGKSCKRRVRIEFKCDEPVKCKSSKCYSSSSKSDKNQGYYVVIHNEGSSSDESIVTLPLSPQSLAASLSPSPQSDLEWDEDIGNVAPTTTEDETWSSLYRWYAMILECTGAALEAGSATSETYSIDQQDSFMRSALHYAAEQVNSEVVKMLLNAGCKVDVPGMDGITALHSAVIKNNIEHARLLIAAGSNVNCKTHEKMTPLHFAASRGFLELVTMLVSNGAYLEARDTNERTALYLAAGRGHIHVVQYLIGSGANVNGEELRGYTPLCEAVWQRYTAVVELLLSSGARVTHSHKLLHNAIVQRQEGIVKMLANMSGGLNLHNDNGDTPLLLATRLNEVNIVRHLLQKGAIVNCCNNITGANALHIAVESTDYTEQLEELLKCLLDYNIDMNATALTGDTPLNRALLLHKDHAAVLLMQYGADVNASDLNTCGFDNLTIASRRSCSMTSMVLKAGHHTNIPDPTKPIPPQGSTAYWLYQASKQPLSLLDICRIRIRRIYNNPVLYRYISALPLPNTLKRFLMLEDEGSICMYKFDYSDTFFKY